MTPTKLSELLEICKKATAVGWGKGVLSSHSLKLEDGINFIEERYHATGPGHSYDDEDKIMDYDAGKAIIADAKFLAALNPQVAIDLITKLQKAIEGLEFYAEWKNWTWASDKVYDDTPLTNIQNDQSMFSYVEANGDVFQNKFGGHKARQILAEIRGSGEVG